MDDAGERAFDRTLGLVIGDRASGRVPQLRRAGGLGAAVALLGVFAWSRVGGLVPAILVAVGLVAMRVGFGARRGSLHARVTRHARVRITAAAVQIDDERPIPRAAIAEAYSQPRRTGRSAVRALDARGRLLFELEAASEEERLAVLRALGRDAASARASFEVASPLVSTAWRRNAVNWAFVALAALIVLGRREGPLAEIALVPGLVLAALVARRRQVVVGVDGLLVRWNGTARFVAYERVRAVEIRGFDVTVRLVEGAPLQLAPVGRQSAGSVALELERDALVARIEEARRAFAERAAAGPLAALLARGPRGVTEWRAELAHLRDSDAGYRSSARGDELWRVVFDPGVPEDARAGAAVALRTLAGAPQRLRVAADAVASPTLRVALERAADPETDEAALEEALAALRGSEVNA